jgi:hypothetical protein
MKIIIIIIIIIIPKRHWGLRERKYQEASENYIGKNFMTWTLHHALRQ